MSRRYVLAPQAAHDLVEIWRYLSQEASKTVADQVESAILTKLVYLAEYPGGGHRRADLTSFYSYLIVYRPDTKPLQVVSILHAHRDVSTLLEKRL